MDAKLIPLIKAQGKEFLIDINKREFCEFDNPENIIKMHSLAGKQIVAGMKGQSETAWVLVSEEKRELEI